MRTLIMLISAGAVVAAESATVTVDTVEDLVKALETYQDDLDVIYVEAGTYDLTGVKMSDAKGGSHLFLKGASLKGVTTNCDDVKLVGDGTLRVLETDNTVGWLSTVENLTVTNGYARTQDDVSYSGTGGGIYGHHYCKNCKIVGNRADKNGGGMSGLSHANKCWILNNSAGNFGGGVYRFNDVVDSVVRGNSAEQDGGGVHGGDAAALVSGSEIVGNTSAGTGGGVCAVPKVTNTFVALNTAIRGAGLAAWNIETALAVDCTVCSNNATAYGGGGIYQYQMVRGALFANATTGAGSSANGGGASLSRLTGVDIHDNHANKDGGGVHQCAACEDCDLRNNTANGQGPNAVDSSLTGCDISGTEIRAGSASRCVFHDIGSPVTIENPYVEKTYTPLYAVTALKGITNCLFYAIDTTSSYNAGLFSHSGAGVDGHIVNCTIVSNDYSRAFGTCTDTEHPLYVENCVFFGNKTFSGDQLDLVVWEDSFLSEGALKLSHVAYGKAGGLMKDDNLAALYADGPLYKFGREIGASPRFAGVAENPDHPYALSRRSPLRRIGDVSAWMTSATDLRGEGYPRLFEGAVDLGCYQNADRAIGLVLHIN